MENQSSCCKFIRKDFNCLCLLSLAADKVALAGLCWKPLARDGHTLLPRYPLLLFILLHSAQEVLTTAGMLHMLNTKVDSFLNYSIPV